MNQVKVNKINKSIKNKLVLKSVSFGCAYNTITNIYGKNGSGKTTLCKLLAGIMLPDKGNIDIDNRLKKYFVSNHTSFYYQLTSRENLIFFGFINGLSKKYIQNYLSKNIQKFKLGAFIDNKYMSLSDGEKKMLSLFKGFMINPNVLILDEPFSSLDEMRRGIILREIDVFSKASNKIVIVSSNIKNSIDDIKTNEYML